MRKILYIFLFFFKLCFAILGTQFLHPLVSYANLVFLSIHSHIFLLSTTFTRNSPRSTGSASSGNSLYKRKYSPHIDQNQRDTPSSQSILAANAKRIAYNNNNNPVLYCIYCTKNDFENLDQLHAHVQQMHAIVLQEVKVILISFHFSNRTKKNNFKIYENLHNTLHCNISFFFSSKNKNKNPKRRQRPIHLRVFIRDFI